MPPYRQSLLSSLAFIGKFVGCMMCGPMIEHFGHRLVFVFMCGFSYIGILGE